MAEPFGHVVQEDQVKGLVLLGFEPADRCLERTEPVPELLEHLQHGIHGLYPPEPGLSR